MRRWIVSLASGLLFLVCQKAISQNIPIESWRTHFSYNSVKLLAKGNNKIFAAAENGLFYLDINTRELNILTKLDGLSDAQISALHYDEPSKTLIIGYESGLVDLHSEGKVTTISDLKNTPLSGSKKVFDIASDGANAYLGTSFGVIVVSLERKEIIDNYRSIGRAGADLTVFELAVVGERLFALTDSTLQSGLISSNLLDFNNWTFQSIDGIKLRDLSQGEQLYAIKDDTSIIAINPNQMNSLNLKNDQLITKIDFNGGLFALLGNNILSVGNESSEIVSTIDSIFSLTTFTAYEGFWLGSASNGVLAQDLTQFIPNGPLTDQISNITFTNGQLFAFHGPNAEEYFGQVDSLGYSSFDNSQWREQTIDGFYNISDAVQFNGKTIYSSVGFGLYDSSLMDTISGLKKSTIGGTIIPRLSTSRGTLIAPSYASDEALYVWDEDEALTRFSSSEVGTNFPVDINVSRRGVIWLSRSSFDGGGFLVRDFEDNLRRIITGSDGLTSSNINGLAINLEDEAWVATESGPVIFTEASFIFNDIEAITPIFENQELFEEEEVYSIAVDGGNRIWMSTRDGLFIFDNSLNALEQYYHMGNSPLPSNIVTDMAYNTTTGEMYLATTKGLVSYRSGSSIGQITSANTKIFPNPVRTNFTGKVGISNVSTDAVIKITDINGKLIRSLRANGGTASWDLLDYNNRKVSSGVYVLLISSFDGVDTFIGKIAVLD